MESLGKGWPYESLGKGWSFGSPGKGLTGLSKCMYHMHIEISRERERASETCFIAMYYLLNPEVYLTKGVKKLSNTPWDGTGREVSGREGRGREGGGRLRLRMSGVAS